MLMESTQDLLEPPASDSSIETSLTLTTGDGSWAISSARRQIALPSPKIGTVYKHLVRRYNSNETEYFLRYLNKVLGHNQQVGGQLAK